MKVEEAVITFIQNQLGNVARYRSLPNFLATDIFLVFLKSDIRIIII